MKVRTFTTRVIQLNNYLAYFPPDCVGQMVTALPDDAVKEILYHAIPYSWRKKMTKQGYNYLDRSIQEMSDFFETRVENLETPLPPADVRTKIPRNGRLSPLGILMKIPPTMKNLKAGKKFCQYHGKCSHSADNCTKFNALFKKSKSNKSKGFRKGGEKTYTNTK